MKVLHFHSQTPEDSKIVGLRDTVDKNMLLYISVLF